MKPILIKFLLGAWFALLMSCNAATNSKTDAPPPGAGNIGATSAISVTGSNVGSSDASGTAVPSAVATATGNAGVTSAFSSTGQAPTSSAASGVTAGGHDCRDDWPAYPWVKQAATECTKCWTCPSVGFLPGMAFVACKIGDQCFRFATVDNCNYENFPANTADMLPVHDASAYCKKDYKNYTFFDCYVNGARYIFETVDAEHYTNFADDQGNIINQVASTLPIPGGCAVKVDN